MVSPLVDSPRALVALVWLCVRRPVAESRRGAPRPPTAPLSTPTRPRAPTGGRPTAPTALGLVCARSRASPRAPSGATRAPAPAPPLPPPHGRGAAPGWRPWTPARAAGWPAPGWARTEVRGSRGPPGPPPHGRSPVGAAEGWAKGREGLVSPGTRRGARGAANAWRGLPTGGWALRRWRKRGPMA